ncbi:G-type lectin S-receptor-like serine/threonine-protein kinase LECRK3 [Ananas comosus]|uniref:Receptor-like serine/threonine-protein kinase n=1 Tax=Ananas comosus TaxID=4615 RepID=A0A6P5GAX6_ANACO|nr:G-type lectin S-receptor-like serine/threonine-protein kinase LECRK3 [Ananas comosus]
MAPPSYLNAVPPPPLLLYLLVLSHALPVTTLADQSHAVNNMTRGTTLSPGGSGSTAGWASASGDFAFGFYPLDRSNSSFLLAVWFANTVPPTLTWFANGDNPVQPGSRLDLTADGELSLVDHFGREVWNANVTGAAYAALLDAGNLVVMGPNSSGVPLWQSFGSPTDTMLPGQVLTRGATLRSRLSDSDCSKGRFQLVNSETGDLVLVPVNVPTGMFYDVYWQTGTAGNQTQLVFSESGLLYFNLGDGHGAGSAALNFTASASPSTADFYHRATIDPDGAFRQYVYPKPGSARIRNASSWPEEWTAVLSIPADVCRIQTWTGSGTCGFNSYCRPSSGPNQTSSACLCPPQYSFIDPSRQYRGCAPDFAPQSCATDQASLYDFVEMADTDWPFAVYDYDVYYPVDEARCKDYCLRVCFCGAAVYRDGYCWKKKLPLSNGRSASYVGGKTLLKVPKNNNNNSHYMFPPSPLNTSTSTSTSTSTVVVEKEEGELILAGSLLIGISGFLNAVLVAAIALAICNYRSRQKKQKPVSTDPTISGLNLRVFSYRELEEATDAFGDELGSGAFGTVYKGMLASESNTVIAVKKLRDLALRESENEFTNEVRAIGRTHHKNLVRLFGFCNEGTHRLLVYEYMSNGSLTSLLFGPEKPSWSKRVRIALEIARGLLYLHDECSAQIIHCDIKPQNILLDDNSVARIADFGLAKLLKNDQTRTSTLCIRGTRGYVAPEWFRNTAITAKVDVYSFGVVLLEIICCRRSVEIDMAEDKAVLVHWAHECLKDDKLDLLVESDEAALADMTRLSRFILVAIWCTQEDPSLRPSMQKAIQMLEGLVAVALPAESVRF